MKRTGRRIASAATVLALLAVAGLAWQFEWRTRPDAVGPRFIEALIARHPGTRIDAWKAGRLHTVLSSGVDVEVRLLPVFDECRADRLHCSAAIERSLGDVDRVVGAAREPRRSMLEPMIVDEPTPGFRFGYVTEPLIGPFEVRYALVSGVASTFVTLQIASRLGLVDATLRAAALERLRTGTAELRPVATSRDAVYRVESNGDAVASLLDRDRMKRLALQVKTTRLYVAIPARGTLYVAKADEAGATAIKALLKSPAGAPGTDLLAYDPDAADGSTLSFARTPR